MLTSADPAFVGPTPSQPPTVAALKWMREVVTALLPSEGIRAGPNVVNWSGN